MDVNPFQIARGVTAASLEFPANRRREVCKSRRFCTRYVGPPPHGQNYLRPKPFGTNNFNRRAASAHQDPPCKTEKSTSATHFCSNTPKTNVRNSIYKRQESRIKTENLHRSTLPPPHSPFLTATDAQNPGAEFFERT